MSRVSGILGSVVMLTSLALAGCAGDGDESEAQADDDVPTSVDTSTPPSSSVSPSESPPAESPAGGATSGELTPSGAPPGTVITTGDSQFGEMLFDSRNQAIYLFEPEADGEPACFDECAEAWPPVLTKGPPEPDGNVDKAMLGTVTRDDGSVQVTYNGWPLYFYANEGPGQVLCHDIVLNGGLWLALGPDGEARPA